MKVDGDTLKAFVALAELLHFGRTAERLNITPAKLTRMVQQLEQEIGESLVSRNSHLTSLTEQGRRLLPSARRIVAEYEWIERQTPAARAGAGGRFLIGAQAGMLYEDLPKRIRSTRRRFPDLAYQLVEVDEASLSSRVCDGSIHIGFTYFAPSDDLLECRTVSRQDQCVAMNPDHRFAGRHEISIEELAGETLILPDHRTAPRLHHWFRSFLDRGSTRTLAYTEAGQIHAALGLCAAGEGICVLADHLRRVRTDDVCYAKLLGAPQSELAGVWRGDSPMRPVAQFLASWN